MSPRTDENVMPATIAAAQAGATTGEWAETLREVFGAYRGPTGVGGAAPYGDAELLAKTRARVEEVSEQIGHRIKILVGKPGLDGHSNGAEQIALRARDVGMEVIYAGIRLTPEQIASSAIDEDVDVVGLSILSGSHAELVPEVLAQLAEDGSAVPVVVGGIIPPADERKLLAAGVARVYTPKDFEVNRIMGEIAELVAEQSRGDGDRLTMESDRSAWLRCYRCWSQNLEIQLHYDAIRRVDPESGVPAEGVDEVQESVVQCLDCMHDQPHLTFQGDRVVPIEDRWERMVAGTPWVASCTVTVDQERVENCSGPRRSSSSPTAPSATPACASSSPTSAFTSTTPSGSSSTCWSSSTRARPRRRARSSRRPPRARSRSPPWPRSRAPRPMPQTKRTEPPPLTWASGRWTFV